MGLIRQKIKQKCISLRIRQKCLINNLSKSLSKNLNKKT